MKPPKFYVGQAVVCVSPPPLAYSWPDEKSPVKGPIYHIRTLVFENGIWCIRLVEIVNPPHGYGGDQDECQFKASRFAPADLLSNEALAELLSETLEPVTA